ncbi:MAG: hypothetical protein HY445_00545 [Candidatus Niyogibacteria bacterium]|nr:hypothetical protein [Candidatus Niyogibacteria bacterium]
MTSIELYYRLFDGRQMSQKELDKIEEIEGRRKQDLARLGMAYCPPDPFERHFTKWANYGNTRHGYRRESWRWESEIF